MPRFSASLLTAVGLTPRVDRPAHQDHRVRDVRILGGLHRGDGADQRHGGLADAERMHGQTVSRQKAHHLFEIIDVVVEVEMALGQRHGAGVDPVGDVDVMARQKGFHRPAQQRGVMARHGRDDQQLGLPRRLALELVA